MIGKTLGHYQITSHLGKSGMGEVYQATDKKLGRDVAIKVLPQEFAKDTDSVARFQRKAKLLASLNHPNIAAIYGLEESGGTNFLVLELVEGPTVAELIAGSAGVLAGSSSIAMGTLLWRLQWKRNRYSGPGNPNSCSEGRMRLRRDGTSTRTASGF